MSNSAAMPHIIGKATKKQQTPGDASGRPDAHMTWSGKKK